MEVAVALFSKEGSAGFSMRRVASVAGVTLSTLQHYFGKGENLVKITINSITARLIDQLRALEHDLSLPPRERFEVLTDEIISWSTDPVVSDCYFELYALAPADKVAARLIEEVLPGLSRPADRIRCAPQSGPDARQGRHDRSHDWRPYDGVMTFAIAVRPPCRRQTRKSLPR